VFFVSKKVLVTGGAGFIGSHLVDRLVDAGHEVTVIDNFATGNRDNLACVKDQIRLIEADVADFDVIASHFKEKSAVFHLAALADIVPSVVRPRDYYRTNVLGTMNVVEAARLAGVLKIVYSASSSCYGVPSDEFYPTPEKAPMHPMYPYALTKRLGEETVLHWAELYGIHAVSLRLFNVYGPRARTAGAYGAVFGVFLAQKLNNEPFTVVGDGTQKRDFVYVTDVAEAFMKAGFSEIKNGIFNVGSGKPESVNTLISLLGGETVPVPKRPGEPECTWADITRIGAALGWRPQVTFPEGVRMVLEQIDHWKDAPVWTPEKIQDATKEWFEYLGVE